MLLSRDKTQLSIYVIGVLLIADFIFFGFIPARQQQSVLKQSRARQECIIKNARNQHELIPGLRRDLAKYSRQIDDIYIKVPVHKSLGMFLESMTRLMQQHGLNKQVIVPGNEETGEIIQHISVTVKCKGKLKQFFSFYRDLEKFDRLISIKKVRMTNNSDLKGNVSLETLVHIFYRSDSRGSDNRVVSKL